MAVYFKIKLQYKRTHQGDIIETTDSHIARRVLHDCLSLKSGPVPSRVLRDRSLTFASTEFPLNPGLHVRTCEVTSACSTFVRGILMLRHGDSVHLQTFQSALARRAASRRNFQKVLRECEIVRTGKSSINAVANRLEILHVELEKERSKYCMLDQEVRKLEAGKDGLCVVSKSWLIPPPYTIKTYVDGSSSSCVPVDIDCDEYFAMVFLSSKYAASLPVERLLDVSTPVEHITKLFEDRLLSYHPNDDGWSGNGSTSFNATLRYFVERGTRIQFCLPAFPCKSTNPKKTSSTAPDGAEFEALWNLHQFCLELQRIYPPGVDFIIVSDGHVFSDCIGTHDNDVYKYTEAVQKLSLDIYAGLALGKGGCPIRFVSLHDVFYGHNIFLYDTSRIRWADLNICRPVQTRINDKDEKCREMMLRSCGFEPGMLEKAIKDDENHPLTKIYRGFSRFMKDDLDTHSDFENQSSSKRNDLANLVAKEMLRRNQAYSHLVELLHPRAIRISIHQHNNHGPKFAINLLEKAKFKPIKHFKDIQSAEDAAKYTKVEEAHIPTPWHNVLAEVEGHLMTYICRNGVLQDEQANAESPFDCEFRDEGRGARWYLKKRVR